MSKGDRGAASWMDPVIHAPARLQIVMQLCVLEAADAVFLQNRTGLTWGNFSSHLGKLEKAGYVQVEKAFKGKKPWTRIRLTKEGRKAFKAYRAGMQEALSDLP